jgi:hypothetical protein
LAPRPHFDIPDGETNKIKAARLLFLLDPGAANQLTAIAADFDSLLKEEAENAKSLFPFVTRAHQLATNRNHQWDILSDAGCEAPARADVWVEIAGLAAGNPVLLNQLRDRRAQCVAEQTAAKAQAADDVQIQCARVGDYTAARNWEQRTYGRHTDSHWHVESFEQAFDQESAAAAWLIRLTTGTERDQWAAVVQLSFTPIPDPGAGPSRR